MDVALSTPALSVAAGRSGAELRENSNPGEEMERGSARDGLRSPLEAVRDPKRLSALREAELLDTPPEQAFDQMIRLASRLLNTPTALVSLVDEDRQFFKACIGVAQPWADARETPLSYSFCQYVVADREPLVVEDAREHPVLRSNIAVPELGVIAYLGVPLYSPGGQALGSLCVIDSKPRKWSEEDVETLTSLAASVMSTIDLRSVARAAVRQAEAAATPPATAQAVPDLESAYEAAETLWNATSAFVEELDAYDKLIRNYQPTAASLAEESRLRDRIRNSSAQVQEALVEFSACADRLHEEEEDPVLRGARMLAEAIRQYLEAEERRAEASMQFQQLHGPLDELERAHAAAASAEGRLRHAANTDEMIR